MDTVNMYELILCLVVYTLLITVFTLIITMLYNATIKLIQYGNDDKKIAAEHKKFLKKQNSPILNAIRKTIVWMILIALVALLSFALYMKVSKDHVVGNIPELKVVASDSMSAINSDNKYLEENNINNQLQTGDLVVLHKLPDEFDLKLYDIILYQIDDTLVLHRIVKIEEPNEEHSGRLFMTQGDAVPAPDRDPVKYSQMKGIYQNQKVAYWGTFFLFLQSPAGYLCLLLMFLVIGAISMVNKRIDEAKEKRLIELGLIGITNKGINSNKIFVKYNDCMHKQKIIIGRNLYKIYKTRDLNKYFQDARHDRHLNQYYINGEFTSDKDYNLFSNTIYENPNFSPTNERRAKRRRIRNNSAYQYNMFEDCPDDVDLYAKDPKTHINLKKLRKLEKVKKAKQHKASKKPKKSKNNDEETQITTTTNYTDLSIWHRKNRNKYDKSDNNVE